MNTSSSQSTQAPPTQTQTAPDAGLGAGTPASSMEVRRLARLFAAEPELILACMESLDQGRLTGLETILAAAEQAIASSPDFADLYYFAARAASGAGHLDQARSLLEQALRINPQYNDALILAARVAMDQGRHDEAIAHLRQALVNGADYADVHLMLGDIWRLRDDLAQSREAYEKALSLNVDLAAARERLAELGPAAQCGGADELSA
jgi:tetratricopeptide (TPR) repeat protein